MQITIRTILGRRASRAQYEELSELAIRGWLRGTFPPVSTA